MTDRPSKFDPLFVIRSWLLKHRDDGVDCPACDQRVKVYRRKINAGQAHALTVMFRTSGTEWFYLPHLTRYWQGRDEAGLRYWGLIEEATEPRDDGGRAGWWRVTEAGAAFARGNLRVPKYVLVYNGNPIGTDGDLVGIRDSLGEKFRLDDLLAGI